MQDETRESLRKRLLADREQFQQLSHDFHKHYRASATAISVTIIGLSSAGMAVLSNVPLTPLSLRLVSLICAAATVGVGVYIQYLHFSGYKKQARWADGYLTYVASQLLQLDSPDGENRRATILEIWTKQQEALDSFKEARDWFNRLDKWTPRALACFAVTFFFFALTLLVAFILEKPQRLPPVVPANQPTLSAPTSTTAAPMSMM